MHILSLENGEGGIRTLGTELPAVQQISNLPLSTTQPPLHGHEYQCYQISSGGSIVICHLHVISRG